MSWSIRRGLCVALLALGAAAPAQAAVVRITEVGAPAFPDRSFLLTLGSKQQLTTDEVAVTENGEPVIDAEVVPLAETDSGFGTVLVIDTSESLHAEGIRSAMSAARAFVATRDAEQPLGVVMFNGQTRVALPLTTDRKRIDAALVTDPALAPGTHIYDGVTAASRLLREAKLRAGAIIVLSDGDDTGSTATQKSAVAAARGASARVYAIGLRTRSYTPGTLTRLASAAGGAYTTASSQAGLTKLYGTLGTELSNQYIVKYRSTARLGVTVNVAAHVRGQGIGTVRYFTPEIPAAAPVTRKVNDSFWASSEATALIVGIGALLTLIVALAFIRQRRNVRSRVGDFTTVPTKDDEKAWTGALVERALGLSEQRRARRRGRPFISAEDIEMAGLAVTPGQLLLGTVAATAFVGWAFAAMSGSVFGALFAVSVPLVVRSVVRIKIGRERRTFGDQLPDNLQVVASAMRAGHTFLGALGVVVQDAPEPSRREFRRVLADEQLGIPLNEALMAVAGRMASRDFEHVALVATLQAETGGNTAEVVDQVAETIRERHDLRRLVRSLTAQGRLAGVVISGLPVFLVLAISALSPGYLTPLVEEPAGVFMLIMAVIMLITGGLLIKKIVNIDV